MNEFKVGLLTIATIIATIFMSLKITTNQSGFGEYLQYKTIVKDASGIFPKTPIKVAGINAGRIRSIQLSGNQALIEFEVLKKVVVTSDSKLRIKTVGFLGDKFLEIIIGKKERLPNGGMIKAIDSGGLENLAKNAVELMDDVKVIVKELKETLVPKDQDSPLKNILDNINEMSRSARDATESLNRILGKSEKRFTKLIKNLELMSENLAFHTDTKNKEAIMADVKRITKNAERMMNNINKIIADMRKGKGTLGKFLVEEEIADEVRKTLSSVRKIVGKVDSIRTELSVYTGVESVDGGMTEAGLRIYPSPERFYHLGMVTSKFGPTKERETTTIEAGSERKIITKDVNKNSYRFNVFLGRKINNWIFRGGLIESSGGLGVDYEIMERRLLTGVEVYDYDKDLGINARIFSEFLIWNVLYGKISAQDFREKTSVSAFAGLKFSDEDLKSIIGFFF